MHRICISAYIALNIVQIDWLQKCISGGCGCRARETAGGLFVRSVVREREEKRERASERAAVRSLSFGPVVASDDAEASPFYSQFLPKVSSFIILLLQGWLWLASASIYVPVQCHTVFMYRQR
jgi:hypothetical protein